MVLAVLPLFLLASLPTSPAPAASPLQGFARCESLYAAQPEARVPAQCFEEEGRALGRREEAASRLRALRGKNPGNAWFSFYLGHLDTNRSEALYREAADRFAQQREARGEVLSRSNLQRVLNDQGRLAEAQAQVELAAKVASASGDAMLLARVLVIQARQLFTEGKDLERAYLLLRRAEASLFPEGEYTLQRNCLLALGNVSLELGRLAEARDAYGRAAALADSQGDLYSEAVAKYGLARVSYDTTHEVPREENRREASRLAQEALDVAIRGENKDIESKAHWTLGVLSTGQEARRHLDACLAAAVEARDYSYCLNALARHLTAEDPQEAQKTIDKALEFSRQAEDYWSMAYSWRERMRVSWAANPLDRAVRDSRSALDAIEALRDLQAGAANQAGMFSTWSEDYYWLSGRLFEVASSDGEEANLERAFLVSERMRARSLIDALEAARAVPAAAAPLRLRRAAVLERISGVQRRLLDPDLPAGERTASSRELETLEIEEAELRYRLLREDPGFAALRRPEFASLSEVRRLLGRNEALLSFQVAPWKDIRGELAGGSWLLVASHAGSRAYRLPGRGELRPAVRLFTGTFERRDGSDSRPAVHLYRQLFEKALAELPPGIERLVILPDDVLNQLPFAALRATPEAPPLGTRYELSLVPSATLWREWKERRPPAAETPALALADPPTPGTDEPAPPARERSAAVFSGATRLGALPYARRESRSLVRQLGGGSLRRLGEEASEAFVKATDLRRFGILHFAAHAVTDEMNPERSGVLLAPGGKEQDGLLQIREIVDLDLEGRVVVLSACRSNAGAVLRGEGVMSLARAFFQAGAHSVVASLWPVRDDDAALFFDRFYRHIGRGLSVSAALRAAQIDRIEAGAPAAAWAGIVVLGDGDLIPLPGGRKGLPLWTPQAAGAGLLLLLLTGGIWRWRKRS